VSLVVRGREVRASAADGGLQRLLKLRQGARRVALSVTPDTAMKHDAVAACVKLIADTAVWPLHAYRDRAGIKAREVQDPEILRAPSVDLSPIEWRRQVLVDWLTRGNAFGLVTSTTPTGLPRKIELVSCDRVAVRQRSRAALGDWEWLLDGQPIQRWPDGPLWHSRALHTKTGVPVGISPIEMALGSIGLGLAAEEFGASWFLDGAHPSAILYTDQTVTDEQAKTVKQRFMDAVRGAREPAVLGAGMKYQQVQVPANESQFLETLDRNVATVARFFGIAPENIGASASGSGSLTYANVEGRGISLLQLGLGPWVSKFEETMSALTMRPQFVKASTDAFLRLDAKTSVDVLDKQLRAGILGRNEARQIMDRVPVEDADDEFVWPPYRAFPIPSDTGGDDEPAQVINVDARTSIEPGAIHIPVDARHDTAAPVVNVDARTELAEGAVHVPVDARTSVAPAEVRVDTPVHIAEGAVQVPVEVDARSTVEVAPVEVRVDAPKPEARKAVRRTVERNQSGDIVAITEE
jgi:HK97 family phage portal protein